MRKNLLNIEPEKHESYGLVSIARQTTHPAMPLFGSSVKHGNLICLKISKGRKYRNFQTDNYMSDGTLIEVLMSPTQFAEAITSFNVGEGVPCTIRHVVGDKFDQENRRYRKPCPEVNFRKQATDELKEEMSELTERIKELSVNTEEILTRKAPIKASERDELLSNLRMVIQEIESNIPFVNECFNRSVNKAVVEAKGEIESTYQNMREKLGDKVLEGKIELPLLDAPKDDA